MFKRILSIASLCFLAACSSDNKNEPSAVILDLSLGVGSGSSFVSGSLDSSREFSAGESGQIGVNIVDLNDNNSLYTEGSKTVEFSSSCVSAGQAFFSSSSVSTSSGLALTTYTNSSCSGEDVITAVLSDDTSKSAQAQVTTTNYVLGLGSGTGSSFQEAVIATSDTALDFGDSATLSVDIINTNGSNTRFEDGSVTVAFSSRCVDAGLASFSSTQVSTSDGSISTVYTANGCATEDKVTATLLGRDESATVTLTTQSHDLRIGNNSGVSFNEGIALSSVENLAATGQSEISVSVVDINSNSKLYTDTTISVEFSSGCVDEGTADFSAASVSTNTGLANSTYSTNGCRGEDVVTATIAGSEQSAQVTVNVAEPELGSISSVVPDNTVLAIQGFSTDTLPATTEVNFVVRDKSGNPIEGKEVRFSLSGNSDSGNDSTRVNLSKASDQSDSSGQVSVFVNSGSANTTFRVIAETDVFSEDGVTLVRTLQTSSTTITVNTGIPTASSFGVGVSVLNPYAWDFINQNVDVVVTASDYHGGPVANGNSVTFKTSGGQIQLADGQVASCSILEGDCNMEWESGPPYPTTVIPATNTFGIAVVMAHTTGEESFVDANANGLFDSDESFTALPEAFHDVNLNGTRDAGEYFIDQNSSGTWDDVSSSPFYRGASCSDEAKAAGHCAQLAEIFVNSAIVMATNESSISITSGTVVSLNGEAYVDLSGPAPTVSIALRDLHGNVPAIGTELSRLSCLNDITIEPTAVELPFQIPSTMTPGLSSDASSGYPFEWGATVTSPDVADDDPSGTGDGTADEISSCFVIYTTPTGVEASVSFGVVY